MVMSQTPCCQAVLVGCMECKAIRIACPNKNILTPNEHFSTFGAMIETSKNIAIPALPRLPFSPLTSAATLYQGGTQALAADLCASPHCRRLPAKNPC